uniref:Uncharacterized protein n=1 Tax=Anguilla anguilla TaxID=7936 RepID=A0A0E9XAC2_ANGAN
MMGLVNAMSTSKAIVCFCDSNLTQ